MTSVPTATVQLGMQATAWKPWQPGEARRSKLVMIGRDLPVAELKDSLRPCLVVNGDAEAHDSGFTAYRNVQALGAGWLS